MRFTLKVSIISSFINLDETDETFQQYNEYCDSVPWKKEGLDLC